MTEQPRETSALVEALRAVVADNPNPGHAGHLRLQVEATLGPEQSQQLRREIHQVVAAAEDHLPTRLSRITPLTTAALTRLSSELATSRGWSAATAERATRTWVAALGHDQLAQADWPAAPAAPARPAASIDPAEVGQTAAPPEAPAPTAAAWPAASRRLGQAHPRAISGEPALSSVQAYAGASLALIVSAVLALTITLIVVFVFVLEVGGLLAPVIGFVAASGLVRLLGYGALIATDSGLEFVPYDGPMRRARPEKAFSAPWHDVTVRVGSVSAVEFSGHRIQVGPRNRAFARAASARAGQARP